MRKVALLLMCMVSTSFGQIESQIREYLVSLDPRFAECSGYSTEFQQYFFADVSFWEVDTIDFTHVQVPRRDSINAIRIAVDSHGQWYRIAGLDTSDYNELIADHPLSISTDNVAGYGQFFLDLQLQPIIASYCHIGSVAGFIALNWELMATDRMSYHPEKHWGEEARRMRTLLDPLELGQATYDSRQQTFGIDYAVWDQGSGDLIYYRLLISEDGRCTVEKSEKLARGLGFWRNILL